MKVSFDFDGTLNTPIIEKVAMRHIKFGDDVHITTTRHEKPLYRLIGGGEIINHNHDLFQLAKKLGIEKDKIHLTNGKDKIHFLETFELHYDDDEYEIDLITRSKLTCVGVLVNYKNYALDS